MLYSIFTSQYLFINYTSLLVIQNKSLNSAIEFYTIKNSSISKNIISLYLNSFVKFILFLFSCIRFILKIKFLRRSQMYSKQLLWNIRTNLPMHVVLSKLERQLNLPFKEVEGFLRFLCPSCHELRAIVNPKNNLSHCFCCKKNFNNIDLLISQGFSFQESVELLLEVLKKMEKGAQAQLAPTLGNIAIHSKNKGNHYEK